MTIVVAEIVNIKARFFIILLFPSLLHDGGLKSLPPRAFPPSLLAVLPYPVLRRVSSPGGHSAAPPQPWLPWVLPGKNVDISFAPSADLVLAKFGVKEERCMRVHETCRGNGCGAIFIYRHLRYALLKVKGQWPYLYRAVDMAT